MPAKFHHHYKAISSLSKKQQKISNMIANVSTALDQAARSQGTAARTQALSQGASRRLKVVICTTITIFGRSMEAETNPGQSASDQPPLPKDDEDDFHSHGSSILQQIFSMRTFVHYQ